MRQGVIIANGVVLQTREFMTVVFFTDRGKDVEFIPPSNTPNVRRADFLMDGLEWEMKSPNSVSRIVLERAFHKALRQSCNVIIDLRYAGSSTDGAIAHLKKCFQSSRRARRLLIITKTEELLDFCKKA